MRRSGLEAKGTSTRTHDFHAVLSKTEKQGGEAVEKRGEQVAGCSHCQLTDYSYEISH